jgi:8-amino-3,8-dideoxy-alpha-D-manno-octulosonate transaminase
MFYCDEDEVLAVAKVIRSKKLFRYQGEGTETECMLFEKEFSLYLNQKNSVLVSSGTSAILLALKILDIGPGDEVLVPAYTFFATLAAVIDAGATPVLVPVNQFLSFDFGVIEKYFTMQTKAIIPVHMDGFPCDMKSVLEFAKNKKLMVVEDCAQGLGAHIGGKKIGTFGDAGCFSFNVDKIISCGEGGAVVVNDEALYQKAMMFHDGCNQFGPTMRNTYSIDPVVGRNMRVSEIQGAMIRVQLNRLEKIISELHIRKNILETSLISKGYHLIDSFSQGGESGTTVRVLANDPLEALVTMKKLNSIGLKSIILANKNGNNLFKWNKVFKQPGSDFFPTLELISRTVAVNISLDETLENWCEKVNSIH